MSSTTSQQANKQQTRMQNRFIMPFIRHLDIRVRSVVLTHQFALINHTATEGIAYCALGTCLGISQSKC